MDAYSLTEEEAQKLVDEKLQADDNSDGEDED